LAAFDPFIRAVGRGIFGSMGGKKGAIVGLEKIAC
jgi:hypothetical protein